MDAFANFRKTLDREMKRLTKTGNGTLKQQAEALTDEDKELFWSKEDHSPKSLLNTMFHLISFATV